MPTDAQLISIMSHTIGSIGQVLKHKTSLSEEEQEIQRIYKGYLSKIGEVWK